MFHLAHDIKQITTPERAEEKKKDKDKEKSVAEEKEKSVAEESTMLQNTPSPKPKMKRQRSWKMVDGVWRKQTPTNTPDKVEEEPEEEAAQVKAEETKAKTPQRQSIISTPKAQVKPEEVKAKTPQRQSIISTPEAQVKPEEKLQEDAESKPEQKETVLEEKKAKMKKMKGFRGSIFSTSRAQEEEKAKPVEQEQTTSQDEEAVLEEKKAKKKKMKGFRGSLFSVSLPQEEKNQPESTVALEQNPKDVQSVLETLRKLERGEDVEEVEVVVGKYSPEDAEAEEEAEEDTLSELPSFSGSSLRSSYILASGETAQESLSNILSPSKSEKTVEESIQEERRGSQGSETRESLDAILNSKSFSKTSSFTKRDGLDVDIARRRSSVDNVLIDIERRRSAREKEIMMAARRRSSVDSYFGQNVKDSRTIHISRDRYDSFRKEELPGRDDHERGCDCSCACPTISLPEFSTISFPEFSTPKGGAEWFTREWFSRANIIKVLLAFLLLGGLGVAIFFATQQNAENVYYVTGLPDCDCKPYQKVIDLNTTANVVDGSPCRGTCATVIEAKYIIEHGISTGSMVGLSLEEENKFKHYLAHHLDIDSRIINIQNYQELKFGLGVQTVLNVDEDFEENYVAKNNPGLYGLRTYEEVFHRAYMLSGTHFDEYGYITLSEMVINPPVKVTDYKDYGYGLEYHPEHHPEHYH